MARFDPIGIIARADSILREHRDAHARGSLADPILREDLRGRLTNALEELELAFEFYQRMTPHWTKFALSFGCGIGGLFAMGPTAGWSIVLTWGSAGLALNDTRDFLDNREQIRRVRRRQLWLSEALHSL
ncbi:MAG TPA: hypothetical protein VJ233_08905 [Hyphomicrobiaceae bacterium]|nr:hypothetical protein [Hyphomicrobiaceae bacterium]